MNLNNHDMTTSSSEGGVERPAVIQRYAEVRAESPSDLREGDVWRMSPDLVRRLDRIDDADPKSPKFIWIQYAPKVATVTLDRASMARAIKASGFSLRRDPSQEPT